MPDTVIKRVGGKVKLAGWIREKLPYHDTYCEPFGGSFAVGLTMPRFADSNYRLVFNDLDKHVFNLFRVMRDQRNALVEKIRFTPYSRQEFEAAYHVIHNTGCELLDAVEWARLYVISNRQSFSGKEDGTWCISRQGENIAHSWRGLPELVVSVAERLRFAHIENCDYADVFRRWDSPQTCFYIDPPYEKVEADYYHVNKERGFDHVLMADRIRGLKGSVAVSYYDSPLVRELYEGFDIYTVDVVKHMQTSGKGKKAKDKGTEILFVKPSEWANEKRKDGDCFHEMD